MQDKKKPHLPHMYGFVPSWMKWYGKLQRHSRDRDCFCDETATTLCSQGGGGLKIKKDQ